MLHSLNRNSVSYDELKETILSYLTNEMRLVSELDLSNCGVDYYDVKEVLEDLGYKSVGTYLESDHYFFNFKKSEQDKTTVTIYINALFLSISLDEMEDF